MVSGLIQREKLSIRPNLVPRRPGLGFAFMPTFRVKHRGAQGPCLLRDSARRSCDFEPTFSFGPLAFGICAFMLDNVLYDAIGFSDERDGARSADVGALALQLHLSDLSEPCA